MQGCQFDPWYNHPPTPRKKQTNKKNRKKKCSLGGCSPKFLIFQPLCSGHLCLPLYHNSVLYPSAQSDHPIWLSPTYSLCLCAHCTLFHEVVSHSLSSTQGQGESSKVSPPLPRAVLLLCVTAVCFSAKKKLICASRMSENHEKTLPALLQVVKVRLRELK